MGDEKVTFLSKSWTISGEVIKNAERLDAKFFYPEKMNIIKKIREYGDFESLKNLCKKGFPTRGDAPYKPKYVTQGVPVLVTDNLTGKGIDWENVSYISESTYKHLKCKIKEGDILLASTGMGSITKVDIVSFIPQEFENKCVATPKLTIIRANEEQINPYYLWLYLRSYFGQLQILTAVRGQTGQLELYPQDVENILVPLIPPSLQEEIASYAKESMKLKAEIFNYKKELRKYKQTIFRKVNKQPQSFVIRGDDLEERFDVQFHYGRELIKSYSNFETKPLYTLIKEPLRVGYTPSRYMYQEEGIPIIKVRSLTNEGIDWDEVSFVNKETYDKKRRAHVQNGDILIVSSAHSPEGIAEKVDVVELPSKINKCMAVAELLIMRVDTHLINPHYLAWLLRQDLVKEHIKKFRRGESAHLYGKDLKYLPVPYPPLALQNEIGEKCATITKLRTRSSQLLKKAEACRDEAFKTLLLS
jgi:restriction endonuclease S subunit